MDPSIMNRILAVAVVMISLFFSVTTVAAAADQQKDFGGVGLQVVPTVAGDLVVLRVVDGTPAAGQGVLPGDLIYRVDDFTLKGSDFGKVVSEHLWGPEGSSVTLHFLRPGLNGQQSVTLQRTAMDPRLTVSPAAQGAGVQTAPVRQ